jgi:hypothetical protein
MRNPNPNHMLAEMIGFLGDAMSGDPSGKLSPTEYAAERNGRHKQALAVAAMKLPSRMDRDDRLLYEALGFTFGREVDKLFLEATFPEGWGTKPTDHYMYTHIVDERGRRRGQYFYKPDFWDTDASLWAPERRFRTEKDYSDNRRDDEVVMRVLDSGTEVYRTKVFKLKAQGGEKIWETRERVEGEAMADARGWLEARFPEYDNPLAYWSLPDTLGFSSFPEGYTFSASGGNVTATHQPTSNVHTFEFDADGVLLDSTDEPREAVAFEGRKWAREWAALIANQPKDPRPPKKSRG